MSYNRAYFNSKNEVYIYKNGYVRTSSELYSLDS